MSKPTAVVTKDDQLFKVRDAARYLNLSPSSVRRLLSTKQIPFCRLGGALRFRRRDLDMYLDDVTVRPTKVKAARSR